MSVVGRLTKEDLSAIGGRLCGEVSDKPLPTEKDCSERFASEASRISLPDERERTIAVSIGIASGNSASLASQERAEQLLRRKVRLKAKHLKHSRARRSLLLRLGSTTAANMMSRCSQARHRFEKLPCLSDLPRVIPIVVDQRLHQRVGLSEHL